MSTYVRPADLTRYITDLEAEILSFEDHVRQAHRDFPEWAHIVPPRRLMRLIVARAHIRRLRVLREGDEESERRALSAIGRVPLRALEAALPMFQEVKADLQRSHAQAYVREILRYESDGTYLIFFLSSRLSYSLILVATAYKETEL
jgi:hypothetical protein